MLRERFGVVIGYFRFELCRGVVYSLSSGLLGRVFFWCWRVGFICSWVFLGWEEV